jgi:hypothetical protein
VRPNPFEGRNLLVRRAHAFERSEFRCLPCAFQQLLERCSVPHPVGYIAVFGQLAIRDHPNVWDDAVERRRDLGDVIAAGCIIVLVQVGDLKPR